MGRYARRDVLKGAAVAAFAAMTMRNPTTTAPAASAHEDAAPAAGPDAITLMLAGDVMTGRGIDQILPHLVDPRLFEPYVTSAREYVALAERTNGPIPKPVDFAYIWEDALDELQRLGTDVRIVNLETAVTTAAEPAPKGINYRMSPRNAPCLQAAAIDCCTLANNHILDWGPAGLLETLETLDALGIKHAGAGADLRSAQAPAILDVPGKGRVFVYAFAAPSSGVPHAWAATENRPGVAFLAEPGPEDVRRIARRIRADRRPGDVVVASIHWGGNWGYDVPDRQRDFAHGLIDHAGIDIVHGHSSHHAKGIEVYRHRPILYGCGDLITDYEGISGYEAYRDDLPLFYLVGVAPGTGHLLRLDMIPLRMRRFRLERASPADIDWLRDMFDREGGDFGTSVELTGRGTLSLRWREP